MASSSEKSEWLEEHLSYEWKMLRHTMGRIQQFMTSPPSSAEQQGDLNAFIESFGVHARNLYKFLTNESGGNFKALDYVATFRAEKTNITISAFQKLDSQIFHPGKNRPANPSDKFHNSPEIYSWIATNLSRFVAALDAGNRAAWDRKVPRLSPSDTIFVAGSTPPQPTTQFTSVSTIWPKGRD